MTHVEVIYDPAKEFAAIVNVDTRMGWGPAFVGPDAGTILQTFVESMPFDVTLLSEDTAITVFNDWLEEMVKGATQTAPSPPDSPVEPMGPPTVDESTPAGYEPLSGSEDYREPQPADADMGPDPGTPVEVVACFLCSGAGVTTDGEDGATQTCAMCKGAKYVAVAAS